MCLDPYVKIAQLLAYVAAGASAVIAAFAYRNNNRIKRGEWLKSLFEKFYEAKEGNPFSAIRREIEYKRLDKYLGVNEKGEAANEIQEEELVNYLNFFEFIAILIQNKQLQKEEVDQLFGYFLRQIKDVPFLKNYLHDYGFENLEGLIKLYE